MKFLGLAMSAVAAMTFASQALASGTSSGVPSGITVQSGIVMFTISAGHGSNPACATTQRWAFDANVAAGQATLSTLLNAYSLQKLVNVLGTGTCSVWPDSETVYFVSLP
jgi:hypothetical protein